jgi:hypothetical protein
MEFAEVANTRSRATEFTERAASTVLLGLVGGNAGGREMSLQEKKVKKKENGRGPSKKGK